MRILRPLIYGLLAILALIALAAAPAVLASPTTSAFEAFAKTRLGNFILFESPSGTRLSAWLTGEIAPTTNSLERLLSRLKSPSLGQGTAAEIEARVLKIRERYHGMKERPELDFAPIPLNQARFIERLAEQELAFSETATGFKFLDSAPRALGFSESAKAFLESKSLPAITPSGEELLQQISQELRTNRAFEHTPHLGTFASRWPHHVRLVPQVKFRNPVRNGTKTFKHDVLVISTNGLSPKELEELATEFSRALFWRTVSFPMKPYGEHLYARLGQRTYDFLPEVITASPYLASTGKRLEPIMQLTDGEYQRLRQYVGAANADATAVLGKFDIKGAAAKETTGLLTQNLPLTPGQHHNCVSWLCLAPIGERGEPLIQLAGGEAGTSTQVDPGRWGEFLVAGAPSERILAVAYWTREPLASALIDVKSGAPFPRWGFMKSTP